MRTIRIAGGVAAAALSILLGACGSSVSTSSNPNPNPPPPGDTTAPTLAITSPSASGTYSTTATTVALSGTAADNKGVTSVTWVNAGNGTSGSASGTASWNIANVTLVAGANQITVTAHDAAGNTGGGTLTVTSTPGGPVALSGSVDSSLINRSVTTNTVYVYSGTVTPTGATVPVATAPVAQDNGACSFSYQLAGTLAAGTYTVAFSSNGTTFRGVAGVTLPGTSTHNFPAAVRKQVGPGKTFANPSDAINAASPGDVIEIDAAGTYTNDTVIISTNNLTLRGVGGARAHLVSTQDISNGKGIWVNDANNTTVENIEFSGATVSESDGENGAGIRNESPGLIVCNGYFHNNQNGILGGGGSGTFLVEYSEFDQNGVCPFLHSSTDTNSCSHNIYVDDGDLFILRYSYSHRSHDGHLVKSRAKETRILYSRITLEDGDGSLEIDIPNGGRTILIGNLIQQGPNTGNSTIVNYAEEGFHADGRVNDIYVVNNTFVNENGSGAFVELHNSPTTLLQNNIFAGAGGVPSGAGITQQTNLVKNPASGAGLVNTTTFDYHLTSGSPARNAGTTPGTVGSISLVPTSQYVDVAKRQDRPVDVTIDIGAYEFQ